jgi:hypothetical protein
MKPNHLDLILENSIKSKINELINVNEETSTSDISPTDRIIGALIKEVYPASLPYQVCSLQPLLGPEGHVISIGRKRDINNKVIKGPGSGVETRKTLVTAEDHILETDFTIEFIHDMINLYGEEGVTFLAEWLKGTLIEDMNNTFITKVKACAIDKGNYVPPVDGDVDGGVHSILFFCQKLYGQILNKTNRFFNPFIVCSPSVGMLLSLGADTVSKTDDKNYLGTVANFHIYIDNESESDYIIVGHQGESPGDAGFIFSPYITQVYEAANQDTGIMKIFVNTRYALTKNPADRDTTGTNSDFYFKFNVNLARLGV